MKGDKESKRKITITVVGSGGCGCKITNASAKRLHNGDAFRGLYTFRWYLHDLSSDISDNVKGMEDIKPVVIIKPTMLDPGAGGVPLCAEMAFEPSLSSTKGGEMVGGTETNVIEESKLDVIQRSSINIYISSLGGGTGGRTISLLIPKMQEKIGGIADIAISILTHKADENLNHIYTFPEINKSANLVILLENGVIIEGKRASEKFINGRAAEMIDFLISSRRPDTYPKPFDPLNYLTHVSRYKNFDKARWLIPFMYPVEGYDKTEYKNEPLLHFVDKALENVSSLERGRECTLGRRCLCKVEESDIERCNSCLLFVKAPKEYIDEFEEKVREVNGKEIGELELFLQGLKNILSLEEEDIFYAFIPEEEGFKMCLLLLNLPFLKLKNLKEYLKNKEDTENARRSWESGVERGVENMVAAGLIAAGEADKIKDEYKNKINSDALTKEFENRYGDVT